MIREFIATDREMLYQVVTDRCALQLSNAVEQNGRASIIVPGGTSPEPVFLRLSQRPLDWQNISISASDERWVDSDHLQSNQRLIEQKLMINNAASASFIPLKNTANSPEEGEAEAEQSLQKLATPVAFTMVGMGTDGHFASLFPGTPQLNDALDLQQKKTCMAIDATGCSVAGEYTNRISLTLSTLINSQVVILLITGNEKLKIIRQAMKDVKVLAQNEPVKIINTDKIKYPITALLAQTKTPVEIHWSE